MEELLQMKDGQGQKAIRRLGFSALRTQQKRAIVGFVKDNDVFVSLLTGSRKSMCFAILPFAFDEFLGRKAA